MLYAVSSTNLESGDRLLGHRKRSQGGKRRNTLPGSFLLVSGALTVPARLYIVQVKPQAVLPIVRSYLKLYTTISIGKLATLLELDDYTVRSTLLLLKQQRGGETDFWIDGEMIHVRACPTPAACATASSCCCVRTNMLNSPQAGGRQQGPPPVWRVFRQPHSEVRRHVHGLGENQ